MSSHDSSAPARTHTARSGPRRKARWAAATATVAVLATAGVTSAFAGVGSAATRTPTTHTTGYWASVLSHGHMVKVHVAAPAGIIYQQGKAPKVTPQQANLTYGGGPVAHNAKVYLDFWGNQWKNDKNGTRKYVKKFFAGLGTAKDTWSRITSQYTDSSGQGPAFTGSVLKGVWLDWGGAAPANATSSQLGAEAVSAASHFGVSGTDIQVIVLSPSGTHPAGFNTPSGNFCAWHSIANNVPFTNEGYQLDMGTSCGENSVRNKLDGFSITAGHEYAETLTDPQPPTGWTASNGEIGDLCAWMNLFTLHVSTGSFAMQPLWNNKTNGCSASA